MKIYNSLLKSHKSEDVTPLDGKTVRIYSCGPTVYDRAHIGNLSTYIFADTLHRAISLSGYEIHHVMNYTDVDDKTIRRSREQHPNETPEAALKKLTDHYVTLFNEDMERVGNDIASIQFVRATDQKTLDGMRELITKLHEKGFAYIADDGVYFSIDAYKKAGKTYGQLLSITTDNTSEARIQNDEYDKESAHDFALWKKQKEDEPAWEFTLDGHDLTGRPGWHIECSVMSEQNLGRPFDIHTGGVDNIFPHHENEIAQSTALEQNPVMATIFAHAEHVLVDGKKMAKSAKNFYTLTDITDKGYDPLAFRLKILQSHYRSQVDFSWESLDAAQNLLISLRAWADQKYQRNAHQSTMAGDGYADALKGMLAAIQDDLNTPLALSILAGLVNEGEQLGVDKDKIQSMLNLVDRLFGLQLNDRSDLTQAQKALITTREDARARKDWVEADKLRDELIKQHVAVRDTPNGPIWYRTE